MTWCQPDTDAIQRMSGTLTKTHYHLFDSAMNIYLQATFPISVSLGRPGRIHGPSPEALALIRPPAGGQADKIREY